MTKILFIILLVLLPFSSHSGSIITNPGNQILNEEQSYTLTIVAHPDARIFVSGMPPGMHWNETERRFDFRPDFIQRGKSWQVTLEALQGNNSQIESFTVTINNNIQPPWPTVIATEYFSFSKFTKITVSQITDGFLDSPNLEGREFISTFAIPDAANAQNLLPVRIGLHAFSGSPGTGGGSGHFAVSPNDTENTWWTGYNDQMPNGVLVDGTVANYTQRRAMHLFSYLVANYPGVDLERVSVSGQSMGGTGSHFLALRYARHFNLISSRIGGTASQLLSNGQQTMLRAFWGGDVSEGIIDDLGYNVWEFYDSSRALLEDKDFRNLHFTSVVGQNDNTINFRHMVGQSPLTGLSFIDALQQEGVGHYIVWDQRAHGATEGPPLGANWWRPIDSDSILVRNKAFPAFSNSSADDNPGVPDGANGFTGRLRGVINRYQRWDGTNIVDTRELFSIPLKVDIDTSGTPPDPKYPPKDNFFYGTTPIISDITIRRFQNFQLIAGESVNWQYNGQSGIVLANNDGSVTLSNLEMMPTFTELVLTRSFAAIMPSISSQPISTSVTEGEMATFNITAIGSPPLSYQWYRNNGTTTETIAGANNNSYQLDNVSVNDHEVNFYCTVSNAQGSVTSTNATLTVILDTVAPVIDEAVVKNVNLIDIMFSEIITSTSAQLTSNYQISDGIQVLGASLNPDGKTVHLQTDNLIADKLYTVTINNIKDISSNANEILADSTIDIQFSPLITFDNGELPTDWVPLTSSRWSVVDDNGNNALFLNTSNYSPLSGNRLGEYILSPDSYANFTLTVEAKTNEPSGNTNADYALVFGLVDEVNYYYMLFNRTLSNTQLFKVSSGNRQELATASDNWLTDNNYHTVEVSRISNDIEIRFDNNIVLQHTDVSAPIGQVGLGSFNDSVYFDNIRINTTANTVTDLIFLSTFE